MTASSLSLSHMYTRSRGGRKVKVSDSLMHMHTLLSEAYIALLELIISANK